MGRKQTTEMLVRDLSDAAASAQNRLTDVAKQGCEWVGITRWSIERWLIPRRRFCPLLGVHGDQRDRPQGGIATGDHGVLDVVKVNSHGLFRRQ
jgi:hypothetical protein